MLCILVTVLKTWLCAGQSVFALHAGRCLQILSLGNCGVVEFPTAIQNLDKLQYVDLGKLVHDKLCCGCTCTASRLQHYHFAECRL